MTRVPAELDERIDRRAALFLVSPSDDNVSASLSKPGAQRPAKHARAADDDGGLAG
jgi:hypothetical protein